MKLAVRGAASQASEARLIRTRELNDALRRSGRGGRVVITAGVAALLPEQVNEIVSAVATFDAFDEANDPYGQHDCGSLSAAGQHVIWKIDYHDPSLTSHSIDAADHQVTVRVLTIMLPDEY